MLVDNPCTNPGATPNDVGEDGMILRVRATAVYEFESDSYLWLMVEPPVQAAAHKLVEASLVINPTAACELRQDLYGNNVRLVMVPQGRFAFEYNGRFEVHPNVGVPSEAVEHSPQELPAEAMVYTLPSRYCQSDLLARMANDEFGGLSPGGGRVQAIAAWVRRHVEYLYRTTNTMTSAYDTATERLGVCRDFAHLVIAFCRGLGIPARYVSGYVLGLDPPDFHGYTEVYLSGAWHTLDATSNDVRPALVPIAHGRDAADVAVTTLWCRSILVEQMVEVLSGAPAELPN
jgi:transglutaminase-like putative cysteine protease